MGEISDVSESIKSILDSHLGDTKTADAISTKIMMELDRQKLLYYSDKGRPSLLNVHGRVLIAIMEDPGITQRALSQYLQVSESNIQKSVKVLVKDGLITKTKKGSRNTYKIGDKALIQHPDIIRFYAQVKNIVEPF